MLTIVLVRAAALRCADRSLGLDTVQEPGEANPAKGLRMEREEAQASGKERLPRCCTAGCVREVGHQVQAYPPFTPPSPWNGRRWCLQEQHESLLEERRAQHRHFRCAKKQHFLLPFSFFVPLAESFPAAVLSQGSWWGRVGFLGLSHTGRRIGLSMHLGYLMLAAFLRQPLGKHWL